MKSLHQELVERFREKFNYASFTWNGDNATGVEFAKKKQKQIESFLSEAISLVLKEAEVAVMNAMNPSNEQMKAVRAIRALQTNSETV